MEYRTEVHINLPRERVIKLFDSAENIPKWQPSLQSLEHLEGEPGQPGARTRMDYDQGNRQIEMVETIVERDFPERFVARYETDGVENLSAIASNLSFPRKPVGLRITSSNFRA